MRIRQCRASTLWRALLFACLLSLFLVFAVFYTDESLERGPRLREHELCVIVPFREREEELRWLVPQLHDFLAGQKVKHSFLVINQTDSFRFNRASLINVGYLEADRLGCDYLVMHDVDLLPRDRAINYSFPGEGVVRHISSPEYHPKYHYKNFIGGILMLTLRDFRSLNGMSNKYWGWGLEDDELFLRIRDSNLTLTRVANLTSSPETAFEHMHNSYHRKRDYNRDKEEKAYKRKRDRQGGLSDLRYAIVSRNLLNLGAAEASVLNVNLQCNRTATPYCLNKPQPAKKPPKRMKR